MAADEPGPRRFIVLGRVAETDRVVSLTLAAAGGTVLPPFEPGQFLTFRIPVAGGRPLPRNYSLSGDPADRTAYRVTIAGRSATSAGPAFLQSVEPGAVLEASGPKGRFTLDRVSAAPVLLAAHGIGLTPIMAMAHALALEPARPVILIHERGVEDGPPPFRRELTRLAAARENMRLVFTVADGPAGDDRAGAIDRACLEASGAGAAHDVYLVGPADFLVRTYAAALALGCAADRIVHETFGPAVTLARAAPPACAPVPARPLVTFAPSGRAVPWDPAARTLLDFCEAQGFAPAFSCRNGICNTCLTRVEGPVTYLDDPLETPEPGMALLCCSAPAGPVTVRF